MNIPYKLLVDAYIEQIRLGFRTICSPNVALDCLSDALEMIEYVKSKNYGCIIANDFFRDQETKKIVEKHYSLIIFVQDTKENAYRIKELLEKSEKTIDDHEEIGKLFGYNQKVIDNFLIKRNVYRCD